MPNLSDMALELVRKRGMVRAHEFEAAGIPQTYLKRLCDQGRLTKLARGLYQLPEQSGSSAEHSIALAAKLTDNAIVCLLSALRHHELTTQLPGAVWITIPHNQRVPRSIIFPIEVVRSSEPAYSSGVEYAEIEGARVPIYNVAKTIADCFKYRNRIGLDVAVEALRDTIQQRKAPVDELNRYAKIDRQERIMRPYIDALL